MRILRARLHAIAQEEAEATPRRPGARRSAPSTAPSGSAPTTIPENRRLRPPHRLQGLQAGPDPRGRPGRRRQSAVDADEAARLSAVAD